MSRRTDFTDVPPPAHRRQIVWLTLVGFQLAVFLVIIAAVAAIAAAGAMSALFAQRVP